MTLTESPQTQIAVVAEGMLSGKVGLVDGCRQLMKLSNRLDENSEGLFIPIVAVESETDDLPLGEARSVWSAEALARKDAEASTYLCQVREVVLEACEVLVKRYATAG
jgi:hypothetical protein